MKQMQAKTGLHALSTGRGCGNEERCLDNDPSFLDMGCHAVSISMLLLGREVGPCPGGRVEPAANQTMGHEVPGGTLPRANRPVTWIVAYSRVELWTLGPGEWAVSSMLLLLVRRCRLPGQGPLPPPGPRQDPYYCLLRCRTDLTHGQTCAYFPSLSSAAISYSVPPAGPVPSFLPSFHT